MLLDFDANLMVRNGGFGGAPSEVFPLVAHNMPLYAQSLDYEWGREAHRSSVPNNEVLL